MSNFFYKVGIPPGMLFLFIINNMYTHIMYYLISLFLPLETVFETNHLLGLLKEPIPDLRKEQPLSRKAI